VWVSWRMDETYIKVKGQWYYLYRAVDKTGQTIDFLLTERNRSGCQNITLVITSSDGVPCAHGHAPLIATGILGTDSA
jgi:putative transposase